MDPLTWILITLLLIGVAAVVFDKPSNAPTRTQKYALVFVMLLLAARLLGWI